MVSQRPGELSNLLRRTPLTGLSVIGLDDLTAPSCLRPDLGLERYGCLEFYLSHDKERRTVGGIIGGC